MRTNLERYFEDVRGQERTIFGRRLRVLRMGHLLQMHTHSCAFVDTDADYGVGDVALCLAILDCPPEATGEPSIRHLRRIGRKLVKMPQPARDAEIGRLASWLADQFRFPKFWSAQDDGSTKRALGAPWLIRLKCALKVPDSELTVMPLPEALWRWFTILEEDGRIQLRTDSENAAIEEALA